MTTTPSTGLAIATRPNDVPVDAASFLSSLAFPPPSSIHSEILNHITTPYDPDALESFLTKHNLTTSYPNVVRNLRSGFTMGEFPPLCETVIFKNHPSAAAHASFIDTYLRHEVAVR
jgi:hypothetical protein